MYEKNIVGVFNIHTEYPVFKSIRHDEKRVEANRYGTETMQAFAQLRGNIDQHDALEKWRELSDHLHDHGQQAGQGGDSGKQDGDSDKAAARKQAHQKVVQAETREAGQQVDQFIEARVRSHILPQGPAQAPAPLRNFKAQPPAALVLHAVEQHLTQVREALPDDHQYLIELTHDAQEASRQADVLRLQDVMSRKVACVRETVTLEQAASVCNRRNFSGLPVLDAEHRLIGELTVQAVIQDLFAPAALQNFEQHDPVFLEAQMLAMLQEPVSRHMRPVTITASPETTVREACRLMTLHGMRRLVVTEGDRIKGVFTTQDAVRVLAGARLQIQ